ncbi:SulP family inorganic anion transporter [Flavobacteriaceae bacterium]|jgi:SulP family sulfate permease|nr:SulP family inorganic anion transporter [Flavobacteriaceae bacterium]MDC0386770.1 SulP family inorganic anion transporter [Flavobacteriaceae bacterium]
MFTNIKGDILGGLTAGIVALPLALAFGVSSGLGPSAGLYGAIFLSFFAALFGGTPTQISGPTAPMTAVSMVVIATIISVHNGSIEKALPYILAVFLLSGIFQIALGMLGVGKYIKYIPYPVVSGFMTAIGVIILITQILPVLGYEVKNDREFVEQFKPLAEEHLLENILIDESKEGLLVLEDFQETIKRAGEVNEATIYEEAENLAKNDASGVIGTIKSLPRALGKINWIEVLLALGTIIIIYGFKKITTAIPSTLVALVIVSSIAIGFGIDYRSIQEIPQGFPRIEWTLFTDFNFLGLIPYILTALTLSLLGAIDSLLTSVVADNLTKTRHLPNKELIGQGIGNSIAAVFGGIPGAGATIRTVVNIQSGGKTKLSGMVASVVLLIILLALSPMASKIPAAVLAGILVTVGIGVMDYKGLNALSKIPRTEVVIMAVVLVLSVFWNLVYAVGIGLVMASLFFMKKMGDLSTDDSRVTTVAKEKMWDDEKKISPSFKENVFIKHLSGPLFFGFATEFVNISNQIPKSASILIIRMSKVPYIDQSGLFALEDVLMDLIQKDIEVIFVGIQKQPKYLMKTIGIIGKLIPEEQVFTDFSSCKKYVIDEHKSITA